MSAAPLQDIEQNLDNITQSIWICDVGDPNFDHIREKLSLLQDQVEVQKLLQRTAKVLLEHPQDKPLPNQQATRVKHFIRFVFQKSLRDDHRHIQLQKLECNSLKFCGLAYTIKEVLDLPKRQFDFLVTHIASFLQQRNLSQLLYRDEIDKAVYSRVDPEDEDLFKAFLKSHIDLRPAKRKRDDIDDHGESNNTSVSNLGVSRSVPFHLGGNQRDNLGGTPPRPVEAGRQIDYRCSSAPVSQIPLLGDLLYDAISSSNQWKWERQVGATETTDCLNALVPKNRYQDISITLLVGHKNGLELIEQFQLAST